MIIRKLPYIIYRDYPDYGYLTDNRNFGYDTASRSSLKLGELLLSKTGSIFYSALSDTPQDIDAVVDGLCRIYPSVASDTIRKDAFSFYESLQTKGFVFWGNEDDYTDVILQRFSYQNIIPYEFKVGEFQVGKATYQETFGKKYQLLRVHIDIASRCNENCIHCYIPSKDKCNLMDANMFDTILSQCRMMNVINITISGGEPLLNPSVKDFLLKCGQYNFSVNLLSNLTLLTDDLIEIIVANPLISVQTSLYAMNPKIHDSITQRKGSFQKTINAIEKLHERNVPLQINCPIMKQNRDCYKDVLNYAKAKNIEADADYSLYGCYDKSLSNLACRLSTNDIESLVIEELNNETNRYKLEESVKNKKTGDHDMICPVCKSSLCISNGGRIYPCEGWQSLTLGKLSETSLADIWENSQEIVQLRNLKYLDFPKCRSCEAKKFCSICLIMNANEDCNGNYHKPNTFLCDVANIKKREYNRHKATVRESLE